MDEMIFELLLLGDGAERKIAKLSCRLERIDRMLDIIDEKRRLESALEIRNKLIKGLTEEEYVLLNARAHGVMPEITENGRGYSDRSLRRKTLEALKTAKNILFLFGYDDKALSEEYGEFLQGAAA